MSVAFVLPFPFTFTRAWPGLLTSHPPFAFASESALALAFIVAFDCPAALVTTPGAGSSGAGMSLSGYACLRGLAGLSGTPGLTLTVDLIKSVLAFVEHL